MTSMPSIRNITLMSNNLSGSIPSSWAVDGSGRARFPRLQALYLQPGMALQYHFCVVDFNASLCRNYVFGLRYAGKGSIRQLHLARLVVS